MALEDDAVKTGEDGDDQAGKLGDEARQRLHGVLLRSGAGANPILAGDRLACSSYLVAALPRWLDQPRHIQIYESYSPRRGARGGQKNGPPSRERDHYHLGETGRSGTEDRNPNPLILQPQ